MGTDEREQLLTDAPRLAPRQAEYCLLAIQGMYEVGGVRSAAFAREINSIVDVLEEIAGTTIETMARENAGKKTNGVT